MESKDKPKQVAPLRVYRVSGQGKPAAVAPRVPAVEPAINGTSVLGLASAFMVGVAVGLAASEEAPAAEPAHARMSLDDDHKDAKCGHECEQDHDWGR